jgi:tetratricopeptide (TPR) repeat protein
MHPTPLQHISYVRCVGARVMPGVMRNSSLTTTMNQIITLILGGLIGGLASYLVSSYFSSTRTDLRKARYLLWRKKYEEALEHYNRFFRETRNTALLWNEIKVLFYAECRDIFPVRVGTPETALVLLFNQKKRAANKIVMPLFFSLVDLYKELSQDNHTWLFEVPSLLINDRIDEALAVLDTVEKSNQELSEFQKLFYFEVVRKIVNSSSS